MPGSIRVHITAKALADLQAISAHIQRSSPQNAPAMIERLLDSIDELDLFTTRYKVVGRSRKTGTPVHAMVVRPYIVYYRFEQQPDAIFILAVRHGARRQPRQFE